jgi:hypothetical protein
VEPIDHEIVGRALREHQTLPLRAENHKAFSALFVDENQLPLLETADWQVIYGRRGTGKTLFLKAREEHLLAAPALTRILPLYLSIQEVIASPPIGITVSDRQQAYGNFQLFLERLADEIAVKADAILAQLSAEDKGSLIRALTHRKQRSAPNAEKIASIVRDLLTFMQSGDLIAAFSDASVEDVATEEQSRRSGRGGRLGLGLSPEGASVSGAARIERERSAEEKVHHTETRGGRRVPRFPNLRHALIAIASALELDRVDIFIDEWSLLDQTAAKTIQPRFAALLRRALFGDPRVTVKIATNRYNTVFHHNGQDERYGLVPNTDIFEAVNLDRALGQRAQVTGFYEELLFKRLLLKEPRLATYASGEGRPGAGFAEVFFEDSKAFEELVAGCEGVPRDFIITFRYLAQWADYSVTPRWSKAVVQDALTEVSMSTVEQLLASPATTLLERGIKPTALAAGSRLFLIPRDASEATNAAVAVLLDQRLIHEYVGRDLPGNVRQDYLPYSIAYGLWCDWERLRGHAGTGAPDEMPDFRSQEGIKRHTVDISLDPRGTA